MRSISVLGGLMLSASTLVKGNHEAHAAKLQHRQLHTLSHIDPSATSTTSTTTSSSSISTPSTTTTSQPGTTLETSTSTGPPRWALTTTFTQPSDCVAGITQYPNATWGLWQNIVEPVPSLTLTSCYPGPLLASATATASTPPFEQLICPDRWETYNYNVSYIICCPSAYGLYAPNWASNTQRPGQGAWCTSRVWPGIYVDITVYDTAGQATLTGTTLGSTDFLLVQATAFDGIVATSAPTTTPTSTSTSSSATLTSTTTTSKSTSTTTTTTTSSSTTTTTTTSSSTHSPTSTSTSSTSTTSTTPSWTGPTAVSQLPSCGQTCFSNMLAQYQTLGCSTNDPACLCRNVNFNYGIRDCSNGACGASVGSSVIAFETSYYCPSATAARTTFPATTPTPTAISQLPACGQTCFSNMMAQYSTLGCSSPVASCLCKNVNFGYGIRDCSNGACGLAVGSTVIAFETNVYCASATAAP